jgi:Uma2 family endonuclease
MTAALAQEYYVSPEEYLEAELVASEKHEYLAGVVYAMSGPSIGHTRIAGNIYRALGNQLSGRPCEAFTSDVKVRIKRDDAEFYYYPDATVDCGGAADQSLFAEEPRVIFEVLSPETARIDRGEKLPNYQSLPSLDVYVLVDQFHLALTVYRRTTTGWSVEIITGAEESLLLPTIDCTLPLSTIYERTGLLTAAVTSAATE